VIQKPTYWSPEYASWFDDASVVSAYHHRPPYPNEVIDILSALVVDSPRVVLDIGAGTGDIARRLAGRVERIDAVDASLGMIDEGRHLPGGDAGNLLWIVAKAEDAPLQPLYALITAGESIHWMDWQVLLPRLAAVMSPHAVLAVIERNWDISPQIAQRLAPIFGRHGAKRMATPFDLIAGLAALGFVELGRRRTNRVLWRPTVDEYIECRHSQNSFSRERMADAAAFDAEVIATLEELRREGAIRVVDGRLELEVEAEVTWGRIASLEAPEA
jgi:ubiquinone/menaquinone biosynthesis C-methylase UbiE